jgi:hypothetical protein
MTDYITKYKVLEIEHDRWSGSDVEFKYFDTREQALAFEKNINSKNTLLTVPDNYVTAEYKGIVEGKIINGRFVEEE